MQQIYEELTDTINCLFRMSRIIRRPAHHDQLRGIKQKDVVNYEFFDCQHVANKFPRADSAIAARLGHAISR